MDTLGGAPPSICAKPRGPENGEKPLAATIYLAPPCAHLLIAPDGLLALSLIPKLDYFRRAADPLLETKAQAFGSRTINVVLSGVLWNGALGTAAVKKCGRLTMAQDKESLKVLDVPSAAIDLGKAGSSFRRGG